MMFRPLLSLALLTMSSVAFAQVIVDPPSLPTITHTVIEFGLLSESEEEVESIEPGETYAIFTYSLWYTSDSSVYDPDKVDFELVSRLHYAEATSQGTITLGQIANLAEDSNGHGSNESGTLEIDTTWNCESNFSEEGVILYGEAYYTDRSMGEGVTSKSDYGSTFYPVAQ